MMLSYYATVSIKLCPAVGNDEYIILRNFNGRSMTGFEVKNVGPPRATRDPQHPVAGSEKTPL